MTHYNLWNTANAVLRGKFIAMNAYIKNTERSQINDLILHPKFLKKQKWSKPKTSTMREIIKILAKINETDWFCMKNTYKESKKIKPGIFAKNTQHLQAPGKSD
jgi:hypothetical protein